MQLVPFHSHFGMQNPTAFFIPHRFHSITLFLDNSINKRLYTNYHPYDQS